MSLLKSCYAEHEITKYFYTHRDEVVDNVVLKKIVDEAVSFFTDTLSQRIQQWIPPGYDVIVAGDIIQNPSFLPLFQDSYGVFSRGYIVPLSAIQSKKYSTYTFTPEEVHIASYLLNV